jgi:hypothetical protein
MEKYLLCSQNKYMIAALSSTEHDVKGSAKNKEAATCFNGHVKEVN